ncbi:J domain-containing protein [Roseomonas eburnea]|uniref:J domain-containing protein n=1 Tax=Neoroseomonas eburnea TaxID=1346889 RepID=A0A9X9X8F2_9PROT|nr:J domain-containing protein [Neoroseomonas eburnea]MBR0679988.1 J domain-containing protein [Neoroseomonas eburnea]
MPKSGSKDAPEEHGASAPLRRCDHPGCGEAGLFRAPRDRSLRDFLWFCLPHVRDYNKAWDYYKGMAPAEIEAHLRDDTAWQRPTWPLGRLGGAGRFDPEILRDPLGVLGAEAPTPRRRPRETHEAPPELRAALDLLGLVWPLDQGELRARYKELAKRYHPDATGGDRQAEERLKDINRAYSLLKRRVPARARATAEAEGAAAG